MCGQENGTERDCCRVHLHRRYDGRTRPRGVVGGLSDFEGILICFEILCRLILDVAISDFEGILIYFEILCRLILDVALSQLYSIQTLFYGTSGISDTFPSALTAPNGVGPDPVGHYLSFLSPEACRSSGKSQSHLRGTRIFQGCYRPLPQPHQRHLPWHCLSA